MGEGRVRPTPVWRAWVPAAVVVAVIVAAVGVTLAVRGDEPAPRGLPVLRLAGAAGTSDRAEAAMIGPEITYRLVGPLPDLGSSSPVARLRAPDLDRAAVARMGRAVGLDAEPTPTADGFRIEGPAGTLEVTLGPFQASVGWSPTTRGTHGDATDPGGGSDLRKGDGSDPGPGAAVPGCDPSTGPCPEAPTPTPADHLPVAPTPPEALPSPGEAERIARDLLREMGVDTAGWVAEVTDAEQGVACAPAGACEPTPTAVFQRTVSLRPVRERIPVQGLDWQVTVGDRGRIESAWGTLTALEELGGYPLRTSTEAFEDLQAGRDVVGGIWALAEPAVPAIAPAEPTRAVTVEVSGLRLGFMVVGQPDGSGALLVPVYEFLDVSGAAVASVVAVTRDLVRLDTPPAKTPPGAPVTPPPGEVPGEVPGDEPPVTVGPVPERPIEPGVEPVVPTPRR